MFEDENDQDYDKESYSSNREALTNNSAVKAAIFVFGLMLCIIVIYVIIIGSGGGGEELNSGEPGTEPVGTVNTDTTGTTQNAQTNNSVTNTIATQASTIPTNPTQPPVVNADFPLQNGTSSDKVKDLQTLLITKKYLTGTADGVFGNGTEGAVKVFQKEYGLESTGVVDETLYNKIQSAESKISWKKGDVNSGIKDLQKLLIEKKYLVLAEDKITDNIGPSTDAAIKAFQKANGLTEDGIVTNGLIEKIKNSPEKAS